MPRKIPRSEDQKKLLAVQDSVVMWEAPQPTIIDVRSSRRISALLGSNPSSESIGMVFAGLRTYS